MVAHPCSIHTLGWPSLCGFLFLQRVGLSARLVFTRRDWAYQSSTIQDGHYPVLSPCAGNWGIRMSDLIKAAVSVKDPFTLFAFLALHFPRIPLPSQKPKGHHHWRENKGHPDLDSEVPCLTLRESKTGHCPAPVFSAGFSAGFFGAAATALPPFGFQKSSALIHSAGT
jgi:hypothetical protein